MRSLLLVSIYLLCLCVHAQTSESPAGAYQWKRGKTEFQPGFVVLKSGKRMEGKISLIGSAAVVKEVEFQGDGKYLTFPAGSLQAYGLIAANPDASNSAMGAPMNDSPESMYEWRNMVVMGKEITSTTPRAGYVVLRTGARHEGELKLRKKAGILEDIEVKTATGKEKFEPTEVARYGYTVSEAEVVQSTLAKEVKRAFPGSITTASGKTTGEVTLLREPGVRNFDRIIFKGPDGNLAEHTPATITGFSYTNKGEEQDYTVMENVFVPEDFNGKTFQLYRNPNPTSINEFATRLAKTAISAGTTATATAVVKADQKRNDYVSNMDSVLRVSTTEQLIDLRDKLAALSGFETAQEAIDKSDNESLKANLSALELAIQGRQAVSTPEGILNVEWVILNKLTREKTIVYKSKYKDQIDVLLMGCDKYLELTKPMQSDLQKWDSLAKTVAFLDGCY
jgi:hypothetical protein